MTEDRDQATKKWFDEAEEALNRIGDSLKAAWDETQEARMATLESAKEATSRLGEALDQGIAAARKKWEPGEDAPTSEGSPESAAAATESEEASEEASEEE